MSGRSGVDHVDMERSIAVGDGHGDPSVGEAAGVGVPHRVGDELTDEQQCVVSLGVFHYLQQEADVLPRYGYGVDLGG